jgi:hypothetical protein
MNNALKIGGALLALAVFATSAEARMMGGMSMSSTSMSRGDMHTTMPTSLASPRSFSPDGHTFSGNTFSPDGLQQKVKGSNWKKPTDADNGGPSDPPNQPPQRTTRTATKLDPGGPLPPVYGPWPPRHLGHCGARC